MNCADNNHPEWWVMHVSEMRTIRADAAAIVPNAGACFVYLSVGEVERPLVPDRVTNACAPSSRRVTMAMGVFCSRCAIRASNSSLAFYCPSIRST